MPPFNAEHCEVFKCLIMSLRFKVYPPLFLIPFLCCFQIIFDNILNRKILWPSLAEMSDEARDLIDKYVMRMTDFKHLIEITGKKCKILINIMNKIIGLCIYVMGVLNFLQENSTVCSVISSQHMFL